MWDGLAYFWVGGLLLEKIINLFVRIRLCYFSYNNDNEGSTQNLWEVETSGNVPSADNSTSDHIYSQS